MVSAAQETSTITELEKPEKSSPPKEFKREIWWGNVAIFSTLHILYVYTIIFVMPIAQWSTFAYFGVCIFIIGVGGVTCGSHRYFSHKAFQAKTPLKIFLMLMQTLTGQENIIKWVRNHRQHHKYSDTDADPHNAKNGFFFSHIGWLLASRHPQVKEKRKTIDISDLTSDPVVLFQEKYYKYLVVGLNAITVLIPYYLLKETFYVSFFFCFIGRYVYLLNNTWNINSFAHKFGTRPYEKDLTSVDNETLSFLTSGEGWHNYHHAFPSDYRTAEFGLKYSSTTLVIDIWAYFGLAYDLKTTTNSLVHRKITNRGDGTHPLLNSTEAY